MPVGAYVICATPRSGSTLLCDLLATSGVAGCPASYFRAEDIAEWAADWGVPGRGDADDPAFDRAYLAAMRRAGTAGTPLFGLRLMPQSLLDATHRLGRALGREAPFPALFEDAFGPALTVHLSRDDKDAQAASLLRATRTGLWHRAADGSERERTAPVSGLAWGAEAQAATRDALAADDAGWDGFFAAHAITPYRLRYETLAADPHLALAGLLAALGQDPAHATKARVMTRKLGGSPHSASADA